MSTETLLGPVAGSIILRPYQLEAINAIFRKWLDRLLTVWPTGADKTVGFAHVALRRIAAVRPLSQKQIELLERYRVDLSVVENRGHASAIIDLITRLNASIPATIKQVRYLYYLGYRGETANLSKPAASQLIGKLEGKMEVAVYG